MKGALLCLVLTITLTVFIEAANRKANIRYVNSMPQFGKAKLTAFSPATTLFDQVPQGYITDYATIDAQPWNFTTKFSSNATASSDETDLDSDSYGTVFTCQQSQRTMKNKVIYDVARSFRPNVALLRTINLAQYNYDIDVYNGSATLFNNVPYCSASSYIQVPPGGYQIEWSVSGDKKRGIQQAECPPNCTQFTLVAGKAYTAYVTPAGTHLVQDAKKNTIARNVQSGTTSEAVETSPVNEERAEKVEVTEVKEEKKETQKRRKRVNRKSKRSNALRNSRM